MPIVFNPGAFQSAGLQQAAADRAPDAMEFALAKARLEGWKEARENDKRRLAMAEQDQAFQLEDRAATMQGAEASSQLQQFQTKPSPAESVGLMPPGTGVRPSDEDENAEIQRITETVTKDPRAKAAFLEDVKRDKQERVIRSGLQDVQGKLQDRIVGMSRTPEAAGMVQEFEAMADELEQLSQPGMEPKLAAAIIDDVQRRFAEKSKLVYEHAQREREDMEAMAMVDAQMGAFPEGHPVRKQLGMMKLGIELGDLDGADVVRSIRAQEMGLQEVQPGVFMDPAKYVQIQQAQQRLGQGQQKIDQSRDQAKLRAEHEREMRGFREREVKLKENKAAETKGGPNVSRGMRGATFGERMKMADALVEAQDMDFDAAWKMAGEMAKEHVRAQLGELGSGAQAGETAKEGDAFLSSMDAEDRKAFEALSAEEQARVRKALGGG